MDTISSSIDSKKALAKKLSDAIKDDCVEDVCDLLALEPTLLNQRFSVSYWQDAVIQLKETPLLLACKLGHIKIVAALLERKADEDTRDFLGRNCFEIANRHKQSRVLQLLDAWKTYHEIPKRFLQS